MCSTAHVDFSDSLAVTRMTLEIDFKTPKPSKVLCIVQFVHCNAASDRYLQELLLFARASLHVF